MERRIPSPQALVNRRTIRMAGKTHPMSRFSSYPPAEARIPAAAFLGALWPARSEFGSELCRYLGAGHCILGNSGRSLLYKLLAAAGKKHPQRNEVLVPGYTCYSVAASAARAGLSIRPYDLDPKSFFPDLAALKQQATHRTLAIVVQHLFGIPAPLSDIRPIAENAGAILIEDAAQALGGLVNGRQLGTQGDFGLFSFGRGKPLPLGGGGALIGTDKSMPDVSQINHRSSAILRFAFSAAAQVASRPYIYRIAELLPIGLGETVFEPKFDVSSMGAIMERLGSRSLAFLDTLNAHRSRIAGLYQAVFGENIAIAVSGGTRPVYTRYPVLAGSGPIPEDLLSLGVRRMYPKALADVENIRPFLAADSAATPGAAQIARDLVTLPTHTGITEQLAGMITHRVNRYRL